MVIHALKYYSEIQRNKILVYAIIRITLEEMMQSEKPDRKGHIYFIISFI